MHPQDFKNNLDIINEAFLALSEELHKTKKENKSLLEEIGKLKNPVLKNTSNTGVLDSLNPVNHPRVSMVIPPSKVWKLGAGWFIEGEQFFDLTRTKKIKYTFPICNVKISNEGQVVFTANRRIFLLQNDETFLVESKIRPFDPRSLKSDLCEFHREKFEFCGESLITYQEGKIRLFSGNVELWSLELRDIICIKAYEGTVYLGNLYKQIFLYTPEGVYKETFISETEFTSFVVMNGMIITVFENTISLNAQAYKNEKFPIISYAANDGGACYVSDNAAVKCTGGKNLETTHVFTFKRSVMCLTKFKNYLLVATQDKSVNIIAIDTRRATKLALHDNVVGMSCNNDKICMVDNNGSLCIWEVSILD